MMRDIIKLEYLLGVLRKHQKALGWTINNLINIDPSYCIHHILLEYKYKSI